MALLSPHEVGQILLKARTAKGLTQYEVAERAGVAQSTYHYYETGRQGVPRERLVPLAAALDLRVEDLLLDQAPAADGGQ